MDDDNLVAQARERRSKKSFDTDLYEDDIQDMYQPMRNFSAPKDAFENVLKNDQQEEDPFKDIKARTIADRESDYHAQRTKRQLSPERLDPFNKKAKGQSYREVMREVDVDREKKELERDIKIRDKREEEHRLRMEALKERDMKANRRRFDQREPPKVSEWEVDDTPAKAKSSWESTPVAETKGKKWDETPKASSWDATPRTDAATPKRSKWDQTPTATSAVQSTPTPEQFAQMTPKEQQEIRIQQETDWRNRYLSDEDLNNMIPVDGYVVLEPPAGYAPIRTPARKLTATPLPMDSGFNMQESMPDGFGESIPYIPGVEGLNYFKAEDAKHFSKLMDSTDVFDLSTEEVKERKIMRLLLKIKNGQPMYRKQAMRQITVGARLFGASALFNQILPLMMSPTLEDQERHLLVFLIDIR